MSCAPCDSLLQQAVRAQAARTDVYLDIPACHNRLRVQASPASSVTAGIVKVLLGVQDPSKPGTWLFGSIGSIAYSAEGGQVTSTMAPDIQHQLRIMVVGYASASAGELVVLVESWREA